MEKLTRLSNITENEFKKCPISLQKLESKNEDWIKCGLIIVMKYIIFMPDLYKNKYRNSSFRLKNWDYTSKGFYFVTLCTHNRIRWFGKIENKRMSYSNIGKIAHNCWIDMPNHFKSIQIDEFIIMPDHIHGIIILKNRYARFRDCDDGDGDGDGDDRDVACNVPTIACPIQSAPYDGRPITCIVPPSTPVDEKLIQRKSSGEKMFMSKISPKCGSLGAIVRSYKSAVSKQVKEDGYLSFRWQPLFYDRIIRDQRELLIKRKYILLNPIRWIK